MILKVNFVNGGILSILKCYRLCIERNNAIYLSLQGYESIKLKNYILNLILNIFEIKVATVNVTIH